MKTPACLLNTVREFCTQFAEGKTCWIAYSGGLDSQVLLSLCSELRAEINLDFRAIHIHHGISPHATAWANHCKHSCEQYGMDYVERTISLDLKAGDSLEEVAREKRYAIFAEYLSKGDVLLTAHHQDDQAETVILQLLRGSGIKGLAAMPVIKPFAKGFHGRPLLAFSRADLQQYAIHQKLNWIEDESNHNTALSRNFIRHEIFPRLTSRWPGAAASIARSASHCAEHQKLLEELLGEQVYEPTLSVAKLLQSSPERQRWLLRTWIHQSGYPLPDTKKMHAIQQHVLLASKDRMPLVQWGEVMLRRHRDDLHLVRVRNLPDQQRVTPWELTQTLDLQGLGVLNTSLVLGAGLRSDITTVSVQFRQGGEMLELKGRGRHTLKNLFQEWNVLPWERSFLPLIVFADKIIAIPGYFLHADFAAGENEMGREIGFEKNGRVD